MSITFSFPPQQSILVVLVLSFVCGWSSPPIFCSSFCCHGGVNLTRPKAQQHNQKKLLLQHQSKNLLEEDKEWKGEIVPQGTIRGCTITPVVGTATKTSSTTSTVTEWVITIDGVEADLGRFSEAIYKQIMQQAKRERFQGFRPGTIPPHLMTTYRAYCMDECARETVLEAMQQNNIRPFADARSQFVIEQVSIPPPEAKKVKAKTSQKKKRDSKGGKILQQIEVADNESTDEIKEEEDEAIRQWRNFDTMDGAIQAGWKPGQSFSFVAKNVKGQSVQPEKDVDGAKPIGRVW
jgi:hypothetical protein